MRIVSNLKSLFYQEYKKPPVSTIAKELGYSRITIHRWINGTRVPDEEGLRRLHKRYGWKPSAIIMGDDKILLTPVTATGKL